MITKKTSNEIFTAMAETIAQMKDYRLVVDFKGEHKGETLLVDFTNDGEPYTDDKVCVWSLQKSIERGTEELDYGTFDCYPDVYKFLLETMNGKECEYYLDSF